MSTNRIAWIDIARGIGIILVLYGHGLNADSYRHIIYSFHMPLFFFLSGVVFHHKQYERFLPMLKKNIKGILIPYVIFAFLSYAIWIFNSKQFAISLSDIQRLLYGIIYGNSNNKLLAYNVSLWFLPCLFATKIGFWLITLISMRRRIILGFLFLFSLAAYFFSIHFGTTKFPFGIETAITAIVFFGFGYLWNTQKESITHFFTKHALIFFVITLSLCIITATIIFELYGSQVDIRLNRFHNYFLFYIGSLSGIASVITASLLIKKNSLLEYIGKYSMSIFVWHLIIFSYFTKLLRQFITSETVDLLRNTYLAPLYTILSIGLVLFVTLILKRLRFQTAKH